MDQETRARLLADPEEILDDKELMAALLGASARAQGANVVDMRGAAMARLESRVSTLETTQRDVIVAAYENLRGTQMIHAVTLSIIEATRLQGLLDILSESVVDDMQLSAVRLVIEPSVVGTRLPVMAVSSPVLAPAEPGFIHDYIALGFSGRAPREVILRSCIPSPVALYHEGNIASEALLQLNCKTRAVRALLALGSDDPARFKPSHATDLLGFFGGVVERVLNRLLL